MGAAARCWVAISTIAILIEFYGQTAKGLTDGKLQPFGADFINYWTAAYLGLAGRAHEIYDWRAFHAVQETVVGAPIGPFHYSYPPVLIILTLPLALVPYVPALFAWLVASWFAFYAALRSAMPRSGVLLLALAVPAGYINTAGGQNGYWTAAFLGGGLVLLERRPTIAGVLFGLLIYKPHLGLMIPVFLIAGRQWRAFFAAAATVIALVGASVLAFGPEIWTEYAASASKLRQWILEDGEDVFHRMLSVFVAARRLGLDVTSAYMVQAAIGVAAAALVAVAWYREAPAPIRYSLAILGTFLATPYLQDYDLVVAAFVVAWLFATPGRFSQIPVMIVSALILLAPIFAAPVGKITGIVLGPLFLIPAFLMVAGMAPDIFRRPRS
ncbi:MAG TPA: glycosyltransferase family 87 protein [Xanthobacteraceae bacterium]|nr:glycosyltransferase family 87 protein [Xanthobacteraceae bacterium]